MSVAVVIPGYEGGARPTDLIWVRARSARLHILDIHPEIRIRWIISLLLLETFMVVETAIYRDLCTTGVATLLSNIGIGIFVCMGPLTAALLYTGERPDTPAIPTGQA